MQNKKKPILPPFVLLCLVAVIMSAAISGVYILTKDTIAAAALEAQASARHEVMADAATMTELPLEEGTPVDYCYEAFDAAGSSIGYISQITVMGFGGEIEVTVGMDRAGAITAIRVGGANFSETSGLGAKTRDAEFTDQFSGKSGMLVLKQDVDSVTGASVSSGAVVGGVNRAITYMTGLLPAALVTDVEEISLTDEELSRLDVSAESLTWMGGGKDIDGWWQIAGGGYVVRATGFGLGPIVVTMAFDANGVVTAIIIGDDSFMESQGYGARVQEEAYWSQFIGRSGEQAYGDDLDGITGASTTGNATLGAINACMTFDPANPGTVPAAENASSEASGEVMAEPAAAVVPDPNPPVTPEPTPDAATTASTVVLVTPEPTPDAATMASTVVLVTPEPTPVPTPDAATTASTVVLVTPEPTSVPTPDAATTASTVVLVTPEPTPVPMPDAATSASTAG